MTRAKYDVAIRIKRSWTQVHLSTAIIAMFVAAGLLWVEMLPHLEPYSYDWKNRPITFLVKRGWPLPCYLDSRLDVVLPSDTDSVVPVMSRADPIGTMDTRPLLIDVLIFVLIIGITAVSTEVASRMIRKS